MHTLFPHRGVPYVVWIKDGKLLNTTDADQVTEKSISEILNNQVSSLETVNLMEKGRPAMLSNIFDTEKNTALLGYTFISKGRIRALDYGTWFHRSGGKTYGRQFTNLSLLDIYEALSYELFRQHGDNFSIKRIVNLVKNPEDIEVNTEKEDKETDSRLYTIDYLVTKAESDSLYSRMLRVINENTEFHASIQKKPTKCMVLRRTSNKDKMATKGGVFTDAVLKNPSVLQNAILDYMISPLNANNEITSLPVLDETGYKGKVDLRFSNVKDLKTLQKELSVYDLALEETERNLLMLVIQDKKQ
jgi:DNA/RNA endonuclease YhcR with UshA esterase domain